MDTINYTQFRANLATTLDEVNENHKPILITRRKGKPAVVISLADFNSYEETAYLMSSANNAVRLSKAIADIENGKTLKHDLIDE